MQKGIGIRKALVEGQAQIPDCGHWKWPRVAWRVQPGPLTTVAFGIWSYLCPFECVCAQRHSLSVRIRMHNMRILWPFLMSLHISGVNVLSVPLGVFGWGILILSPLPWLLNLPAFYSRVCSCQWTWNLTSCKRASGEHKAILLPSWSLMSLVLRVR